MERAINFFTIAVLCLHIFAGYDKVKAEVSGGCVGPFFPPKIHGFSYTDFPLIVEVSVTSDQPVTFNWQVRKWYEDWPVMRALYYYIPDKGDDQFNIVEEKNGNTTKVRITGGRDEIQNVLRMICLQISVHHPCTTLQYVANAVTLQRLADGTVHFHIVREVARPEYIVHQGEDLSVPLKTAIAHPALAYYGFARHLRREGDELRVQQRLENIERYNDSAPNITYSKRIWRENNVEKFSVQMKFTPWSEADSGVYVVSLRTSFSWSLPKSDPDKNFVQHLIRAFFDVRSEQVVPPAIIVYNELDWMFRGDEPSRFESTGTYIVPLSKASKWATSVRCIAHGGDGGLSMTTAVVNPNEPREPFENKSTVIHTKTVTADAFSLRSGEHDNFLCKAKSAGKEVSLTFWTTWFTPVRIIQRSPRTRYFTAATPVTFRCVGKTEPTTRSYIKFYRFNETFNYYPHNRKAYLDEHQTDELTPTIQGVTLTVNVSRDRRQITGVLTIHNPTVLQGVKTIQCLVGDNYSFVYYRFWLKTW